MFVFMFSKKIYIYFVHVLGVCLSFWSTFLLGSNIFVSFLVLAFYFIIPAPFVDCVYAFIACNYFIITLSVSVSNKFISYLCVFVSGISVAGCTLMMPELYTLGLFPFFAYLFLWLMEHNISKSSKKLTIDALMTFILFIVAFLGAFICEGTITAYPKVSKEYFETSKLLLIFPSLHSKFFLAAIPSMFAHHKTKTELLTITCYVCASLFRVKPLTTPGADLTLASAVSTRFFDVAGLSILSGSESKFLGILSTPLLFLLIILGRFFNSNYFV